jgi:hypothetical protein
MTAPEQPGKLQRWRAWWLSEPARGTASPMSARWAAIFRRATRSRAMAIVAPVLPAPFVAASPGSATHRSASARASGGAIVFSVLLAVPLIWRQRYRRDIRCWPRSHGSMGYRPGWWLTSRRHRAVRDVRTLTRAINWRAALALTGAVVAVLRWRSGDGPDALAAERDCGSRAVPGIAVRRLRRIPAAAIERGERRERERHRALPISRPNEPDRPRDTTRRP